MFKDTRRILIKVRPRKKYRIYTMNHITWTNEFSVVGWRKKKPKIGDILISVEEVPVIYVFVHVTYNSDEMFYAAVEAIGELSHTPMTVYQAMVVANKELGLQYPLWWDKKGESLKCKLLTTWCPL